VEGAVAPVVASHHRRSSRFLQVAVGCAALVLAVVALAAVVEQRRDVSLGETELHLKAVSNLPSDFQQDSEAAIKIKAAKKEYDDARSQVHTLKEGLKNVESKLSDQLKKMDDARDDLVRRIKRVEKLPNPKATKGKRKSLQEEKKLAAGTTALVSAPGKLKPLAVQPKDMLRLKGIAKKIMFPEDEDSNDPITKIEDSVLNKGWGDAPAAVEADKEKEIDDSVMKDLKKVVHRHLRSVSAGVEAARTTRDAADAAEHALGYTQHIAAQVGDLAQQTEKQADRVVAAAKLTAEARDAMRAALQQSSQIVDYNTHAARAVAQDAGFVTTASSAIAKYLDGIFADRKTVRKVSSAVLAHLRSDEKKADDELKHIEQDEAHVLKDSKYAGSAEKRSERWSKRSSVAAKTAAAAANHALQGEQAALQSGLKALGYARSAREADGYAEDYADEARRAAQYAEGYGNFWQAQTARRYNWQMPQWRVPVAVAPDSYPSYPTSYPPSYPYTPFGTAPYGYGMQGSAPSPLKRAKELVDSVVVLMQHLTRSLETAGPNCQLVQGYLATYQSGMAHYRAEGVGLGNLLSDEDMNLVEQYAEVQVQSFATDLEDAMANAESYCGLAGGVSLANGAPTVALGQVTSTHTSPYMRCLAWQPAPRCLYARAACTSLSVFWHHPVSL
jgi:hypothetical protein